MESIDT